MVQQLLAISAPAVCTPKSPWFHQDYEPNDASLQLTDHRASGLYRPKTTRWVAFEAIWNMLNKPKLEIFPHVAPLHGGLNHKIVYGINRSHHLKRPAFFLGNHGTIPNRPSNSSCQPQWCEAKPQRSTEKSCGKLARIWLVWWDPFATVNYTHKRLVFLTKSITPSWWFQPIWKILVKLDHFPR